jgi:hypothetical protein
MFGIRTEDKFKAWWGARAIFTNRFVDLLHDRQSWEGEEKEKKALEKWLNKTGLPKIRKLASSLDTRDHEEVRFEDDKHVIVANPRASYGYLYIGAWSKVPA